MKNKLRVWWIPQVPMKSYKVEVNSVEEGVKIMDVLAEYDEFQYHNNIKPDYCNTGGLEMFDNELNEWISWFDEETGEDDPRIYLNKE